MKLTALTLNVPMKCVRCNGAKVVDHPSLVSAYAYSAACNGRMGVRRRDYPGPIACPCCDGSGEKTFTDVSERLQGILDEVASGGMPELKSAPAQGDDWWHLLHHPEVICHKLGFSDDYWFYIRGGKQHRKAMSFF